MARFRVEVFPRRVNQRVFAATAGSAGTVNDNEAGDQNAGAFSVQVMISAVILIFSMAMLIAGRDENVYLPLVAFMISFWLPSPVTTAKKADPSSKQQKTVVIEVLHVKFPHATFLFLAQAFYSLTGILFCFLMLSAGRREPSKYLPIITAIVGAWFPSPKTLTTSSPSDSSASPTALAQPTAGAGPTSAASPPTPPSASSPTPPPASTPAPQPGPPLASTSGRPSAPTPTSPPPPLSTMSAPASTRALRTGEGAAVTTVGGGQPLPPPTGIAAPQPPASPTESGGQPPNPGPSAPSPPAAKPLDVTSTGSTRSTFSFMVGAGRSTHAEGAAAAGEDELFSRRKGGHGDDSTPLASNAAQPPPPWANDALAAAQGALGASEQSSATPSPSRRDPEPAAPMPASLEHSGSVNTHDRQPGVSGS